MASSSAPFHSNDENRPNDLHQQLVSATRQVRHPGRMHLAHWYQECLPEPGKSGMVQSKRFLRRTKGPYSLDAEGNTALSRRIFPFAWAQSHCDRIKPPKTRPGASLRSKKNWWNDVLLWLKDMMKEINECTEENLYDSSSLDLEHDKYDHFNAGHGIRVVSGGALVQRAHGVSARSVAAGPMQWRVRVGRGRRCQLACAAQRLGSGCQGPYYYDWRNTKSPFRRCSLDKVFFGPESLPPVSNIPSHRDAVKAAKFLKAHKAYQKKHWEHLEHLGDSIFSLILEVKEKLKDLAKEEEWRQTAAKLGLPKKAELPHGVLDKKDIVFKDSDLYSSSEEYYSDSPDEEETDYWFGPYKINADEVFYTSSLSYAMVNTCQLFPGHVLVCPRRVVKRFTDLNPEEISDLWKTAKEVGTRLELYCDASALSFVLQDGFDAGQSVPHVHVHVIPRKERDQADCVSDVAQEMLKLKVDIKRKGKITGDLAEEAEQYRHLFD